MNVTSSALMNELVNELVHECHKFSFNNSAVQGQRRTINKLAIRLVIHNLGCMLQYKNNFRRTEPTWVVGLELIYVIINVVRD